MLQPLVYFQNHSLLHAANPLQSVASLNFQYSKPDSSNASYEQCSKLVEQILLLNKLSNLFISCSPFPCLRPRQITSAKRLDFLYLLFHRLCEVQFKEGSSVFLEENFSESKLIFAVHFRSFVKDSLKNGIATIVGKSIFELYSIPLQANFVTFEELFTINPDCVACFSDSDGF